MHVLDSFLSIYAVDTKTNQVLVEENSEKSFIPASCMKVVTTAAALSLLGPDMRFETKLQYDGHIDQNGTLHGNIYIYGGGDPCLGSDRIPSSLSWKDQIALWILAIRAIGIQKIQGSIIGDNSKWEASGTIPSWESEDIGNYYGAGPYALSFHENFYTLTFKPGTDINEETKIVQIDPNISKIKIKNEVKTGPIGSGDLASIYGAEFSYERLVKGTVPAGVSTFSIKGSIPNPHLTVAQLLSNALITNGILIEENFIHKKKRYTFHTTYSPPLKEIIHWTNQKSINLYAEHLLKTLGHGSTNTGIVVVKNWLTSHQIDLTGFKMADGSGLSRQNAISTKQLVSILFKMMDSPHFSIFYDSLPVQKWGGQAKSGSMTSIIGYVGFKKNTALALLVNQKIDQKIKETIHFILSKL
jgi:D-alanyl-D-alanine carboxypeptidase/D-alanyl-D-alanine-endopeptidase (penicillin-binding protein 4)